MRLAVVEGTDFGSAAIGNLVSGPIFARIGYVGVFAIASALNLLSLLWITFFLKESIKKREENETDYSEERASSGIISLAKTSIMYMLEGFRTLIKPREQFRRLFVIMGR